MFLSHRPIYFSVFCWYLTFFRSVFLHLRIKQQTWVNIQTWSKQRLWLTMVKLNWKWDSNGWHSPHQQCHKPGCLWLQSSLVDQLDVCQPQCSTVGDRSFTFAGAPLRNSLSSDIVAYVESNGHVTDDVTRPQKVKVMTPVCLGPNIWKIAGDVI